MRKILKYISIILAFIVIDAFVRSIIPNVRRLRTSGDYDFWSSLGFHMVYFIAFQSWFYYPIAVAFYGLSNFIKFNRLVFIVSASILAYAHYLFYCFTTGDSFGSENFYIRSLQYVLFGGLFGAFRYHMMLLNREKSTDV